MAADKINPTAAGEVFTFTSPAPPAGQASAKGRRSAVKRYRSPGLSAISEHRTSSEADSEADTLTSNRRCGSLPKVASQFTEGGRNFVRFGSLAGSDSDSESESEAPSLSRRRTAPKETEQVRHQPHSAVAQQPGVVPPPALGGGPYVHLFAGNPSDYERMWTPALAQIERLWDASVAGQYAPNPFRAGGPVSYPTPLPAQGGVHYTPYPFTPPGVPAAAPHPSTPAQQSPPASAEPHVTYFSHEPPAPHAAHRTPATPAAASHATSYPTSSGGYVFPPEPHYAVPSWGQTFTAYNPHQTQQSLLNHAEGTYMRLAGWLNVKCKNAMHKFSNFLLGRSSPSTQPFAGYAPASGSSTTQ